METFSSLSFPLPPPPFLSLSSQYPRGQKAKTANPTKTLDTQANCLIHTLEGVSFNGNQVPYFRIPLCISRALVGREDKKSLRNVTIFPRFLATGTKKGNPYIKNISDYNRPIPSCCEPYYENEAKCKAFHMKISFVCI